MLYFYVSKTSIQKLPYGFSIRLLFPVYFLSHVIDFQECMVTMQFENQLNKQQPEQIALNPEQNSNLNTYKVLDKISSQLFMSLFFL